MKKLFSAIMILTLISILAVGCGDNSKQDGAGDMEENPPVEDLEEEEASPDEKEENPDEDLDLGEKLSQSYLSMMDNEKYLMKYKMSFDIEGREVEGVLTAAVDGDRTAMISDVDGMEATIITKDNMSYIVNHDQKTILEMPADVDVDIDNGEMGEIDTMEAEAIDYIGTGKEDGLVYEEYTTEDGEIKYYFDGDKLVKIVYLIDGESQEMEIIEMTEEVPEDIFDLPKDYQVMELPGN